MPRAMIIEKFAALLTQEAAAGAAQTSPDVLAELREPGSLVRVAERILELDALDIAYLAAIPSPLLEAIRAALVDAVAGGRAVHLQYSPGYDFEVRVWDYGEAVSIHVSGPYLPFPRDQYLGGATTST